jgi:predicted nucleotidyltransferase component of viral defense system
VKKTPLDAKTMTKWAQMVHTIYLDALMSESGLTCEQIVFHGGTSLHLSWRSPRFSEDLDFLLSKSICNLDAITEKIKSAICERFLAIDPGFAVEIRDKTRNPDRMPAYQIVVSNSAYIGNVMVKAEFWRVDQSYLEKYPAEFKTPASISDFVSHVANPVPVAMLETAYCDKLTAFATRPRLKWRDIYDLWWIGTQTNAAIDIEKVVPQFLHNVSAYATLQDLPPDEALRLFLNQPNEDVIKKADPDLKKWLPDNLWERLNPAGVRQMVDYVYESIDTVSMAVRNNPKNKTRIKP